MPISPIRKAARVGVPSANLADYEKERRAFHWREARRQLAGLPGGGFNIAYEAVDRHLGRGRGQALAVKWLGKDGQVVERSYADLAEETARFAAVLSALGVRRGECVFTLLGRVPALFVAALGTMKAGAVFSPLFSAFGPEPVFSRLSLGDARVLVTTTALYQKKVAALRPSLPGLKHVLLTDGDAPPPGTENLGRLLAEASPRSRIEPTRPEDPALVHFTSGTTGRPKGAVHVHEAAVAHYATGRYALDLREDDVFWCTADPGWVTGTSYGIIAPLIIGASLIVDEAEFDVDRWYEILERERVSVWYTAPTAIRMLMKVGDAPIRGRDLSALRFMASVGEPLNAEAVLWSQAAFGRPFHDNWWQTETGGIMIANYAAMDVKPGSMGKPLPGIEARIVRKRGDGTVEVVEAPMVLGEIALKKGWPSMFRGYLGEEERYRRCFCDDWYLSGDLAMCDAEGYFWFVGRSDDVIKTAGHLVGPFEVESALLEHPAVAEAAVIGLPDEIAGERIKAFVCLKPGRAAGDELARELLGHARRRLGAAVAPKEIAFRRNLPRTRSGKIMRRLLKARELGLPEGDLSTLESDEQ